MATERSPNSLSVVLAEQKRTWTAVFVHFGTLTMPIVGKLLLAYLTAHGIEQASIGVACARSVATACSRLLQ